jgi:hypothetical protein
MDLRNLGAANLVHGRRSALRSVGMGLAALGALPLLTSETTAKKRRKKRKKCDKPAGQGNDRCLPQVEACEKVAARFCQDLTNPDVCLAGLVPCCQPLGTCSGDQSVQCVIDAFTKKV